MGNFGGSRGRSIFGGAVPSGSTLVRSVFGAESEGAVFNGSSVRVKSPSPLSAGVFVAGGLVFCARSVGFGCTAGAVELAVALGGAWKPFGFGIGAPGVGGVLLVTAGLLGLAGSFAVDGSEECPARLMKSGQ